MSRLSDESICGQWSLIISATLDGELVHACTFVVRKNDTIRAAVIYIFRSSAARSQKRRKERSIEVKLSHQRF